MGLERLTFDIKEQDIDKPIEVLACVLHYLIHTSELQQPGAPRSEEPLELQTKRYFIGELERGETLVSRKVDLPEGGRCSSVDLEVQKSLDGYSVGVTPNDSIGQPMDKLFYALRSTVSYPGSVSQMPPPATLPGPSVVPPAP